MKIFLNRKEVNRPLNPSVTFFSSMRGGTDLMWGSSVFWEDVEYMLKGER